MKTLNQIEILSPISNDYRTTITIVSIQDTVYYVFVKTNHKGVINEFEQRFDNYKEAIQQYLEEVNEFSTHTALMNL